MKKIVTYNKYQPPSASGQDPVRELGRLSDFLGTNRDGDFLQMVAMETSLDAMRIKKEKVTSFVDENGQPIMYRKGWSSVSLIRLCNNKSYVNEEKKSLYSHCHRIY